MFFVLYFHIYFNNHKVPFFYLTACKRTYRYFLLVQRFYINLLYMATAICQVCPPLYNTLGGKSILRISLHDWTSRLNQSLSSDITENTKNNKGTVYVPALDIVAVGGLTKLLLVCENYTWVSSNFNVKQCTVREWKWSHPLVIHSVLTWRPKKNLNQRPIWQTVHNFSFFLT